MIKKKNKNINVCLNVTVLCSKLKFDITLCLQVSNSVSDGESLSPERDREGGGGKVTRVIGGLPIAEYEGSPRRYGPRREAPVLPSAHSLLASPSVYSPRPGFPQVRSDILTDLRQITGTLRLRVDFGRMLPVLRAYHCNK